MKVLKYGNTNTFYIEGTNGGMLIDTDYAGTISNFFKAIKQEKIDIADIQYMLATHYHPDHIGIMGELQKLGVKLVVVDVQFDYIHASDEVFIQDKNLYYRIIDDEKVRIVSIEESREYLHKMGFEGEIIHTPSHSADSISLILDDGSCFVGDLEPRDNLASYDDESLIVDGREAERIKAIKADWKLVESYNPKKIYYGHR
ncbi:MAG: MBL fold metallo-hydrolase [Eubacterium sp.]|nr:MBL fold metallo-hydrolase [Eubacterium sp.]